MYKKIISILAVLAIMSAVCILPANAAEYTSESTFIWGDVDFDGAVTVKDATLIQKGLAKIEYVDAVQRYIADPQGIGYSVKNATAIQKYLAKYESSASWGAEIPMASQDEFSSKIKISDPEMENILMIRSKNNSYSYCAEDFPELDVCKIEKVGFLSGGVIYELFLYDNTEIELLEAVKKLDYRANIDLAYVEFGITLATADEG